MIAHPRRKCMVACALMRGAGLDGALTVLKVISASNAGFTDARHDKTPRRVSDRMAGSAFALAADPSHLAAHARHRGRLHHRVGAAGRCRRVHRASRAPRLRRRQCHHPAQGARAAAVGAGRARQGGRRRQYAVVRRRYAALDQHRHRRFSSTISTPRAPGWDAVDDALVLGAGGSSRAVRLRADRARHRARASRQPHRGARAGAGRSVWPAPCFPWHGRRSARCCRARNYW